MTTEDKIRVCISDLRMSEATLRSSMKSPGIDPERKVELREHKDARKYGRKLLEQALSDITNK